MLCKRSCFFSNLVIRHQSRGWEPGARFVFMGWSSCHPFLSWFKTHRYQRQIIFSGNTGPQVKQAETQSWDEKPGLLGVAHAGQMLGKELLALPQAAYPAQDTRCRFGWFFTGYPTVKGKTAHVRIIQLQPPPWKRCSYLT